MNQTKDTLSDLNSRLFEQLDRLNDGSLKGEKLHEEINRSKAVEGIAKSIINNGNLVLNAQKFRDDKWDAESKLPQMLEGDK